MTLTNLICQMQILGLDLSTFLLYIVLFTSQISNLKVDCWSVFSSPYASAPPEPIQIDPGVTWSLEKMYA